VLTGMILIFLFLQSFSAFRRAGLGFFSTANFLPETSNQFGIAALLPGSAAIAVVALALAMPTGIAVALYISEYAPSAIRRAMIAVVDLMAAIPSVIYALWGFLFFMPRALGVMEWIRRYLGFIPIFASGRSDTVANYAGSVLIAGSVVSLMVIPIITSLSRQVFSQAPQGEREAAYALGSTKWGMIRTVIWPFGRAGVIGASILGLGRALGETIAVTFILTPLTPFFTIRELL
jgi:phosphate transport system permease protein